MAFVTGRAQHPVWKAFKTILFVLVILAAAGAYLYMHPATWNKWVKGTPLAPAPAVTQMYKWRDANGQWQISDRPPDAGVKYEVMKYRSDTNVVPSLPAEEKGK
jgi:hypothetical protein